MCNVEYCTSSAEEGASNFEFGQDQAWMTVNGDSSPGRDSSAPGVTLSSSVIGGGGCSSGEGDQAYNPHSPRDAAASAARFAVRPTLEPGPGIDSLRAAAFSSPALPVRV